MFSFLFNFFPPQKVAKNAHTITHILGIPIKCNIKPKFNKKNAVFLVLLVTKRTGGVGASPHKQKPQKQNFDKVKNFQYILKIFIK